jgi:hypothetical protein
MTVSSTTLRTCPTCDARYKVVRVEAHPADKFAEITCEISCMSCGSPLQGREGHAIFKYFLVSDRRRRAREKPPGLAEGLIQEGR